MHFIASRAGKPVEHPEAVRPERMVQRNHHHESLAQREAAVTSSAYRASSVSPQIAGKRDEKMLKLLWLNTTAKVTARKPLNSVSSSSA
mmetsp:Transcript_53726/g.149034  ORF Transcript_53726/g.149034 Transcript_53726/m.149034 type:complete len:89 (-) Transcript_53726:92-358(-)